jgi:hypothetical protein
MSTLREEFQDSEYRRAYAESLANTIIATQIRLLRGSMTQAQFAELAGLKQSRISAMEDENYSAWSTTTLKRLAAAKDVVFLGRFVTFGELLDWSRRLSESSLRVTPFSEDPTFAKPEEATMPLGRLIEFAPYQQAQTPQLIFSFSPPADVISFTPKPPAPRELEIQVQPYGQSEPEHSAAIN